ncbi:MAG: hypothetical protein WC384_12140 [Prolixibacteraceae bacterium]|jgi:hypothetical protein
MRKNVIISGIVVLVVALSFFGIKFFSAPEAPVIQTFLTKQNPAYKAVPLKSPLIIEVKNQDGFFNALKGDFPVLSELRGIPEFENLVSDLTKFRDFVSSRSGISALLKSKSIIISVNPSGKNELANLYLVQLNDDNEAKTATNIISGELGSAYSISRRNYDNSTIFSAKSDELNFYFACAGDIFVASEDFILIEEAIRQAHSVNLLNNRQFTEVYKTIEETALANVFINHLTIHQIVAKFVAPDVRKTISQIASYSNWSGLDLSAKTSELELNGYSVTKDSIDNYLNIFRNQEADKLTIDAAIPYNASYFVALNLKSSASYIDQYEEFLRTKGNFYPREMKLIEFRKKTNSDPVRLMKEITAHQVAGVYTTINKSESSQNRFFVAELNDESDAREKLDKVFSEFRKNGKTGDDKLVNEFSAGSKNSFEIYRLPFETMAESLFGRAFSGINTNYYVLYKKYLICGDNLPGLKNYLLNLVAGKTLAVDSTFQASKMEAQEKPNFYLYSRVPKVFRLKDVLLRPEYSDLLSKNEDIIRKYSTFSWQFSVSGGMIKNRLSLKFDPNAKEEPQAVWQIKLGKPLAFQPKFVLNHKDIQNKEVVVCDQQNNVSLISKDGAVLWTINIPGEIVGDIHQIDIYRTNRYQYIFNTKTQLFVIDRLGNKVGKFPVTLKSVASNGVSVAEYGKNKEYRFFVAGEDKKIYVFDRDGRLVPQWKFEGSESLVTAPIRHLELDGKDYLIFADKTNAYFLDRQGKNRGIQSSPFERSKNQTYLFGTSDPHLITTDLSGRIYILDITGQQEIKDFGKFGSTHRFAVADLDGNGTPEYLFADGKKLSVFASDGKVLFEHSFNFVISEAPFACSMGEGVTKIGVVVEGENKIYLLSSKGAITRGFPLDGDTSFILGKFNDSNSWFNLVTGAEGGMLVNYRID